MLQRLADAHRRRNTAGFTLIELLVVIVILGILSAVVVFAVRGVGDKGKTSALSIDERTIQTAEEAHCGKFGTYADGPTLVERGFLSDLPQYHTVFPSQTGGNCNGWKYTILRTAEAGPYAPGQWATTNPPPNNMYSVFIERLADGRVLVGGQDSLSGDDPEDPIDNVPVTAIWDPVTTNWTSVDPFPDADHPIRITASTLLLTDDPLTSTNECASGVVNNCGKVLVREKFLFDATKPPGSQWETLSFDESTCSVCAFGGFTFGFEPRNMLQLKGDASICGTLCGKIMITGDTSDTSGIDNVLIYDPKNNSYTDLAYNYDPDRLARHTFVTQLPDGRVYFCCFDLLSPDGKSDFFDPLTLTWSPGPQPADEYSRGTGRGFGGQFPSPEPIPVLPNGDLLFVSHGEVGSEVTSGIYTPQVGGPGSWRLVPRCSPTGQHCTVIASLPDGRVLSRDGTSNRTVAFNPATDSWDLAGEMNGSADPTSMAPVFLDPTGGPCGSNCGKVFVASLGSAELFTP